MEIGSVSRLLARVAKWQTRWLQVPVFVRTWGFKSPLAHHGCLRRKRVDTHLFTSAFGLTHRDQNAASQRELVDVMRLGLMNSMLQRL